MRVTVIRVGLVAMLVLIAMAPAPARQSRDAGAPVLIAASTGSATLTGRVVTDAAAPAPVRRATVRLEGAAGTSTRMAGTDDEGRFVLVALPAGTFTLSAAKPGYVQTFHGLSRPGRGPGVPIAVTDGARIDVTLRMLPGAAITGLVTDSRGSPTQGITVHAVDLRRGGGVATVSAITDDLGVYRIFGLAPGEYVITAVPGLGPAGGRSAIRGAIFEVTDAEAQWARALMTGASSGGATPQPGRPVSLAPVYYPGSLDAAAAATVKVAAGEDRAGIDLPLRLVFVASVSGTIIDALGQPISSATVSMFPRRRDRPPVLDALLTSSALVMPRGTVTPSGFTIPGVAPGEYTIVARSGSGQRGAAGAPAPPDPLFSVVDISIDGNDQTGVVLRLLPGLKISGSIAFESSSLTPPEDVGAFELSLSTSGPYLGITAAPRAAVDRRGQFAFTGLPPGTYTWKAVVSSTPGAAPWVLKSAMLNGRDLADRPLESIPGNPDLKDVVITFTDRTAGVSGRIIDSRNQPVTQYSIVVFAADRSFWWPGSRRVQRAQPATDGSFAVAGLPAGEYAIAAADNVEASDLADPAFLARLLASAYKFTLADGEKKKQDLSVGGR